METATQSKGETVKAQTDIRNHVDIALGEQPVLAAFDKVGADCAGRPVYSVTIDGQVCGYIRRTDRFWGTKSAGRRYYNNTGTTTGWTITTSPTSRDGGYEYDTRKEAARALWHLRKMES
jgi:hypothetical protein